MTTPIKVYILEYLCYEDSERLGIYGNMAGALRAKERAMKRWPNEAPQIKITVAEIIGVLELPSGTFHHKITHKEYI